MPRRLAILLALLIALGSALYLDVYGYFSSRKLISELESSLIRLEQYDKNVEQKKEYLAKLERLVQPRTTLAEIESSAKAANLKLSLQKDGTYLIEGICDPEKLVQFLEWLLGKSNVIVHSLSIDARQIVPVVISEVRTSTPVNVKMVLKGVMLQ